MREITEDIKKQIEDYAKKNCGNVPDEILKIFIESLIDSWIKGEMELTTVGE